jgi:ribosomal protein L40E
MRKQRTNFKKRSGASFPILTRSEIEALAKDAINVVFVHNPELAKRNAGLLMWEYLSGKRISEATGRDYFGDSYDGLTIENLRYAERADGPVLQYYIRVLKRGKRKKFCPSCNNKNPIGNAFCSKCGTKINPDAKDAPQKEVWVWKELDLSDPFSKYVTDWLDVLKPEWRDPTKCRGDTRRVFAISRMQAWRIMDALGIINHVNRRWITTHESSTKTAQELQEKLDRATTPTEYIHNNPEVERQKSREAAKKWQ